MMFLSFNSYMLWPEIKQNASKPLVLISKFKNLFTSAEDEAPSEVGMTVEPVNSKPLVVRTAKKEPAPEPKQVGGKTWCEGNNLEWRVPDGVRNIKIKYKESNGRLILDYDFKVNPQERIEIKAE